MNRIIYFLLTAAVVLSIPAGAAIAVIGLDKIMGQVSIMSHTEANFRAACATVKGNVVWNGKHWECLK